MLQCFQRLSFSLCSFFVCLSLTHTHSADCPRQPLHRLYPWGRRDSTKALMLYLLYCRRHSGSLLANDIGKQENVIKELAIKQSSNLSQFDLGKWVDMRCVKHRPGRFSDMLPAVMKQPADFVPPCWLAWQCIYVTQQSVYNCLSKCI